jgi:hypothetical protein
MCDFCSHASASYAYTVSGFVVFLDGEPRDETEFRACLVCHGLIQQRNKSGLLRHSIDCAPPEASRDKIKSLHELFWETMIRAKGIGH